MDLQLTKWKFQLEIIKNRLSYSHSWITFNFPNRCDEKLAKNVVMIPFARIVFTWQLLK